MSTSCALSLILRSRKPHLALAGPLLCTVLLFLEGGIANSRAQSSQDLRLLTPGVVMERELSGGQTNSYQIALGTGQFIHVKVEQKAIDVLVRVFAPDGQTIGETDNAGIQEAEDIFLVSEATGNYRLEISPAEKNAKAGAY